jgi:putative ABC transport system ATP-binding protein
MVILKDVKKTYRVGDIPQIVINSINLKIKNGDFIAIMGPSGSGKSTLLHLIGGIDHVTSGEIWINGLNLTAMNDLLLTRFRRNNIGFVFQRFNLIPTLTVEENILLPLLISGNSEGESKKSLNELLGMIGLIKLRNHKPGQLSGGQMQKVAIARAFITRPEIIILDEPTGSLDSKNSRIILELITEFHRDYQKILILATHNPFVAKIADKISFLKDGHIVDSMEKKAGSHFSADIIYKRTLNL